MKNNSYERAAEKESLLGSITQDLETKGNAKNTAIETLKDLVIGVVAGGVAGSAIGRASLIVGAAVTGLGHYYKSRLAAVFGIGMMAANGYQSQSGMKGTQQEGIEGALEGARERVMAFKDTFQQKLFLDKVLKKEEKKDPSAKGIGEVHYFSYPENKELGEGNDPDLTAMDHFERQIEESAERQMQKQQVSGDIQGNMGDIDPAEHNF